jgi:aryl-alcohol dehydrogenase-like predicted oxidoreductase
LHDVVQAGKVRYLGASAMFAWQFAKAQHTAALRGWTRFVSMQNHYNLMYREEEREMIPQCLDQGIAVIPFSPLARGVPSARVALAWLLHKPVVTAPIIGATKLRHIEDALTAEQFALSQEEISRLEEKYLPHQILGHS